MTASLYLGIRDAVAAIYAAGTPLAGGRIYGNRNLSLEIDSESQIQVYRVRSLPERMLVGPTAPIDWTTELRTVIKARKGASATAEAIADDICCACYSRIMADQTLGGRVQLLVPGEIDWDQEEVDTNVVVATWDFRVAHRTEAGSIA